MVSVLADDGQSCNVSIEDLQVRSTIADAFGWKFKFLGTLAKVGLNMCAKNGVRVLCNY